MPRMPRVNAAATCVRVAGLWRGWLLRRLRRVRSLRCYARLFTQVCLSNQRRFLHDGIRSSISPHSVAVQMRMFALTTTVREFRWSTCGG